MEGFNDLTLCVFLSFGSLLISSLNFIILVRLGSRLPRRPKTARERLRLWDDVK